MRSEPLANSTAAFHLVARERAGDIALTLIPSAQAQLRCWRGRIRPTLWRRNAADHLAGFAVDWSDWNMRVHRGDIDDACIPPPVNRAVMMAARAAHRFERRRNRALVGEIEVLGRGP